MPAERPVLDHAQAVLAEVAVDVDDGICQIEELLLVDRAVAALEVAGRGAHHGVFQEGGLHEIDLGLAVAAEVNETVAAGAALHGEERVENEGIAPVVIESGGEALLILDIFTGIEQRVSHIAAVVQQVPTALAFFIVDLDDGGLAVQGHAVIVEEARGGKTAVFELPLQLRPGLLQPVVVLQASVEQIAALLQIALARLPEDVEQVHALDGDVAETVCLVRVPEDLVGSGAGLELLPHDVIVGLLEAVLLQDDGQNLGEDLRLLPVIRLPGEDGGAGKGVHGVGVLGDDHVVQPAADRLKARVPVGRAPLLGGVSELPPVFGGHGAPLDAGLSGLVLLQDGREGPQPVLVHRQTSVFFHRILLFYFFKGSTSSSRRCTGRSGATGRDMQR